MQPPWLIGLTMLGATFRQKFLSIDPRTAGVLRFFLALLLLLDLAKRWQWIDVFYTNHGLLPNHSLLWRPVRRWFFSWFFSLTQAHEVQLAFCACALVYLGLLVGYRTRLCQVLSWVCFVSLTVRTDILSNGGDFVLAQLLLWTLFIPLGRRFSLDGLLRSLRERPDASLSALAATAVAPRATQASVSLAVLAATLQLSVIYLFNTLHKSGETWLSGSAIHYLLHQARIVTAAGLWSREHLPAEFFQVLTYATLVVEGVLPLCILSPLGRPWTRRLSIVLIWGLHASIALVADLGMFSPTMMTFALLLIDKADWEALGRVMQRRTLALYIEETDAMSWQLARVLVRIAPPGRIEVRGIRDSPPLGMTCRHAGLLVLSSDGQLVTSPPLVWERLLSILPFGTLLSASAAVARPLVAAPARGIARRRASLSAWFGLQGASSEAGRDGVSPEVGRYAAVPSAPYRAFFARFTYGLKEGAVLLLIVAATSQLLVENPAVPKPLRLHQPEWIKAVVAYTRLNQGWKMFAPDSPTSDMWIVVDARTLDGRHVDPFNELASQFVDPLARYVPERLGQSHAFCSYTARIANRASLHRALSEWVMRYSERTGRRTDRITGFQAYVVEQRSPDPASPRPTHVRSRVFLKH